ncbi:PstS family phosphate ABC transporter substrate-binding protein [Psychrobacillus sp. OK032]|uniref:PstS family phosphate ABC transporter substrate-binding protein n=1 Tax=Psychrobacillus sp. OK032 TaxID=1884358 RepID=UPI0008CEACB3|nr:substrate-binding domain-containing protein [Psychrobacillus sp. OK032]SES36894.1 phosphate transport system substrate-binding protein [Psychrobacillus sp. OK032]
MEKKSLVEPILYALFVLVGMFFLTLFILFIVLLTGNIHYVVLIITTAVVLYVSYVCYLFHFFKTKKRKVVFGSIAGAVILVSSISPIQQIYKNWIPSVDAEVNVYDYMPFSDSRKIATLDYDSTLKLTGDLPKMDGATALYPLYSAFVQATYPKKEYDPFDSEVMVNTTIDAYTNLINGRVDMIFAAAPSTSQVTTAKQNGKELKMAPIGREAFVFFVHQKNPISGLSMEQIKNIYGGKVTNWQEVGGAKDNIRAFQRPADSGSQSALEHLMGELPIMEAQTEDIATGMGGIIKEVSQYKNYKNAIGYTFRFYSTEMVQNKKIKLLEIEGVAPTRETIRSGEYPIASEFYIVTAGTDNPNVEKFIAWILSPQGQELIEKTGYVSLE